MATLREAVNDFLAQPQIAVAGVSRSGDAAANLIYRRLRDADYDVFAVNPKASTVEGDPCYSNLTALPEPPDGVVIATPPGGCTCARSGLRRPRHSARVDAPLLRHRQRVG